MPPDPPPQMGFIFVLLHQPPYPKTSYTAAPSLLTSTIHLVAFIFVCVYFFNSVASESGGVAKYVIFDTRLWISLCVIKQCSLINPELSMFCMASICSPTYFQINISYIYIYIQVSILNIMMFCRDGNGQTLSPTCDKTTINIFHGFSASDGLGS